MNDEFDIDDVARRLASRRARILEGPEVRNRAAVAAVLRAAPQGPEVFLIRRAQHPKDPWSGHMAFPGGRHDATDPDLLATSLRETREEVGIDLARDARLLGRLDDMPAVARGRATGMVISPFVFAMVNPVDPAPNAEVSEWLWASVAPMVRGAIATTFEYPHEGVTFKLPAFDVHGRIVWGLTYQMLQSLFRAGQPGGGS